MSGGLVAVDSGERRIVGIDAEGRLSFLVRGESRENGFYNARLLGFDSLGRFYLDDTVMDIETTSTTRRQVLRFSPSGRYLGAVVGFDYEGEAMSDWESHPIFGQIRGDDFHWFKKDAEGTWNLATIPLALETGARAKPLPDIDVYQYLDAAVLSEREVFFLHTDGKISRWTEELGLKEWFVNAAPGRTILFPTCMAVDAEGRIVVGDGKREILRLDPRVPLPRVQSALRKKDLAAGGYTGRVAFQDVSASRPGEIVIGNEYTGDLVRIRSDGRIESFADIPLSPRFAALRALAWTCAAAATLAAWAAFVLIYARALRQRTPLVLRQLLVFIPLIGVMVAAVSVFVFQGLSSTMESQIKDRLVHLAQLGAARTSAADMDALDFGSTGYADLLESDPFQAVAEVADELVNLNEDPWNASIYPYIYKKGIDAWWVLGSFEYVELYPYSKPEFELAEAKGERAFLRYSDVYGEWLSALEPILRADGSTAALFEASMSADVLDEARRGYARRAALGGAAILAVFVVAFSIFTAILLRSVRELRAGAERVSAGDYDSAVDIRSRDEIEELGDAFNAMTGEIKGYVDRLADFGRANSRFVPKEFLASLGRESITDVRLGDQVLTEMAVLFSDIRGFTGLSETLGPAGTMGFLNEYLARMGPVVRQAGGFIDKFVGDAVMALFPEGPADAVHAAREMSLALDDYRDELRSRGEPQVDAGFGLHVGPMVLGVVGEEERFEGTVVSDAVNLASRLESLTRYYGIRILLSGAVKDRLDKSIRLRFLDLVRVKGRNEPVKLYELMYPGDPLAQAKLAAAQRYVEGFRYYRAGRFGEARTSFKAALAMAGDDRPCSILLERCARLAAEGAPAGWAGITEFHDK